MNKEHTTCMMKNDPKKLLRLKIKVIDNHNDEGELIKRNIEIRKAKKIALVAGAHNMDIGVTLVRQLMDCLPISMRTDEEAINAALALICGVEPQDELESALATQMAAIHHVSLEMLKRVMYEEQTTDGVSDGVNRVTKLMRTFTTQMETLQKYRFNEGKANEQTT